MKLLGQGDAWQRAMSQARQLRLHHATLITGERGIGKSTAALCLAQALLCDGEDPLQACGRCAACGKIQQHPDLHWLQVPQDKAEIPVDLVRELQESLLRSPMEGRARVVILDPADGLNVQGQNAMLKTLEEPGRDSFLLLPTRRPEAMLETVRSRVAHLRLRPLSDALLMEEVADAQVVALAQGSLGLARTLLEPESEALINLLHRFMANEMSPVGAARQALAGVTGPWPSRQRAQLFLLLGRRILAQECRSALATEDLGPYSAGTSVPWTGPIESLLQAEIDLQVHIPPEQVLVGALQDWRRLQRSET